MLNKIKKMILITLGLVPCLLQGAIYFEEPKDFNPTVEAAGCFIEHQDKFLMLHRQDYKPQGNLWGIPGGKLDKAETPLDAVIRETYEETHFDISESEITYSGKVFLRSTAGDCIFHIFVCRPMIHPDKVKIAFKEHKGFTWVTPKDALKMNLMQDEESCIEMVYGND